MKFIAIFFLIAAASAQNLAPAEFLAQVWRHTGTAPNEEITFVALGVMINQRHILTTAHTLDQIPAAQLRVYLQSTTFRIGTDIRQVQNVIVHDNFVMANRRVNNIAILRIPYSALTTITTRPRMLGTLTPRVCRTFIFPGWDGNVVERNFNVTTIGCPANTPFCSDRIPLNAISCTGATGSPVICEDGNFVDGFNIDEMDCGTMTNPPTAQLSMMSIHTHVNWIIYHSDANITSKISGILVLLGVVIGKMLM